MVKRVITHSLEVYVKCFDTPFEVTDATAALTVLEQFKRGVTLEIPVSSDDSTCTVFVPYHAVCALQDCPTVTEETVADALCEERTPSEESDDDDNEP